MFSCEFCEISNKTFFIEHLQTITSVSCKIDNPLLKLTLVFLIFQPNFKVLVNSLQKVEKTVSKLKNFEENLA